MFIHKGRSAKIGILDPPSPVCLNIDNPPPMSVRGKLKIIIGVLEFALHMAKFRSKCKETVLILLYRFIGHYTKNPLKEKKITHLKLNHSVMVDSESTIKYVISSWEFEGCGDLHLGSVTDAELKSVVGSNNVV